MIPTSSLPPSRVVACWSVVETPVTAALADWLEEWHASQGAVSVSRLGRTELDDEAQGGPPQWSSCLVRALYSSIDAGVEAATLLSRLGFVVQLHHTDEASLLAPSQVRLPPRSFAERLLILGEDDPLPPRSPKALVRIEPGSGFGTGTHPTTALCLEWLARHNLRDLFVLDYGTGSGILALAALALGARRAWGIDTDPLARLAARANARRNGVGRRFLVRASPRHPPFAADLVCANLLFDLLVDLGPRWPRFHRAGAHLLVSGILTSQVARLVDAYHPRYSLVERLESSGWAALLFHHEEHAS